MPDDLEADIRAAQEQVSGAASQSQTAPEASPGVESTAQTTPAASPAIAETPKTEGERVRDESGRFAPKTDAKTPEAPKPADAAIKTDAATPAAKPADTTPEIAPPLAWKGAGKVDWKRLPKAVQQEISQEFTRTTETSARLQKLESAIGPERIQLLSATYGSVEQGLQNLFAISDMATKNPTGFIQWFAQQRGINPETIFGQTQQQGGQHQMQPTPAQQDDPIVKRLSQLETMIQTNLQQQQQGTQSQLMSDINAFAADPAHPYFNDVRTDMGILMKNGRATDLKQAYDMAIWANPETRKSLIEEQRAKFVGEQASTVTQALNASSSISGSPAGAKIANQEPDETLEQTIIRAQQQFRSG